MLLLRLLVLLMITNPQYRSACAPSAAGTACGASQRPAQPFPLLLLVHQRLCDYMSTVVIVVDALIQHTLTTTKRGAKNPST